MDFDEFERHFAGVGEAVVGAQRDVGGLVFAEEEGFSIAGDFGSAAHDDPVLGAVVMHLQAETGAGVDDDALDLEAGTFIDAVVRAPGAIDLAMLGDEGLIFELEAGDDVAHILGVGFVDNHDGIGGFDDNEIFDADGGDETTLGEDEAVGGVFEHDLALKHVARIIFGADFPEGIPGADIAPPGTHRDYDDVAQFGVLGEVLHDGVVDGVGGAFGEGFGIHADEIVILLGTFDCGFAGLGNFRLEGGEGFEPDAGAEHEDAGIPEVVTSSDVFCGTLGIGLFDKGGELAGAAGTSHEGAGAKVAIAGFGMIWDDAEGDDGAFFGLFEPLFHGGEEGGVIGDDLVGRHDEEDGVFAFGGGDEGGKLERGGSVAPDGLEHDAAGDLADLPELLSNDEAVIFIGDDDGGSYREASIEAIKTACGDLQEGLRARKGEQLFGV